MGNFSVVWFCTSPNQITVEELTSYEMIVVGMCMYGSCDG